jgi:hypothetical protein
MALEPSVIALLSNGVFNRVFKVIAEQRTVQLKDIRDLLLKNQKAPMEDQRQTTEDQLREAVDFLKDADLIKERSAPIDDFATYYVTADGLNVERALRRAKSTSASP